MGTKFCKASRDTTYRICMKYITYDSLVIFILFSRKCSLVPNTPRDSCSKWRALSHPDSPVLGHRNVNLALCYYMSAFLILLPTWSYWIFLNHKWLYYTRKIIIILVLLIFLEIRYSKNQKDIYLPIMSRNNSLIKQ